jgi:hypothetical protein
MGATTPRMGVFVVDNGGHPFAAVGPVARAWQLYAPRTTTTEQALQMSHHGARVIGTSTWLFPEAPEPPMAVTALDATDDPMHRILLVRSRRDIGMVTIELLDPHGTPIGTVTHPVNERPIQFVYPRHVQRETRVNPSPQYINNLRVQSVPQTIRIRVGTYWYERPTRFGEDLQIALGGMRPIDDEGSELRESTQD